MADFYPTDYEGPQNYSDPLPYGKKKRNNLSAQEFELYIRQRGRDYRQHGTGDVTGFLGGSSQHSVRRANSAASLITDFKTGRIKHLTISAKTLDQAIESSNAILERDSLYYRDKSNRTIFEGDLAGSRIGVQIKFNKTQRLYFVEMKYIKRKIVWRHKSRIKKKR